jgi:hypothetical protein
MHISKAKKATEEREEQMRQYEESIARAEVKLFIFKINKFFNESKFRKIFRHLSR